MSERHLQKSSSFQGPVFFKESQELQGPSCGVGKSQDVVKSCEVNGKDVVVFFLLKAFQLILRKLHVVRFICSKTSCF